MLERCIEITLLSSAAVVQDPAENLHTYTKELCPPENRQQRKQTRQTLTVGGEHLQSCNLQGYIGQVSNSL